MSSLPRPFISLPSCTPTFRKDDRLLQCFFCRPIQQGRACPFNLGPTCSGQTGLETQVKGGRERITCRASRELGSSFSEAGDPPRLSRLKVRGCHGFKWQGGGGPRGGGGRGSAPPRSIEAEVRVAGRGERRGIENIHDWT